MAKNNDKKKPAKAAAAAPGGKLAASVGSALHPGQTKPTDAGRPSAEMGGKGSSSKKGR